MGQVFLIKSSQLFTQSWILLLLMEPERFVSLYPEELAGRAGGWPLGGGGAVLQGNQRQL